MILGGRILGGIAKALLTTAAPPTRTAGHRSTVAGSVHLEPRTQPIPNSIATDPMSTSAIRGLAIRRSLSPQAAAKCFVDQMQSYELTGERTWHALWEFYLWLCEEEQLIPLPENMQARFAHELGKLCRRGQVRIREGGKLRRLTTYTIPDLKPACLRTAA